MRHHLSALRAQLSAAPSRRRRRSNVRCSPELRNQAQHKRRRCARFDVMKSLIKPLSGLAAAALFGFSGPAATASDTFVYEIVAGWTIRTDLTQNYACYAETLYEGESILRVGFDADKRLFVRVGDPQWNRIQAGGSYDVAFDFGDDAVWTRSAEGYAFDTETAQPGLHVDIARDEAERFMTAFMHELALDVTFEDREALSLSLAGSYRAGTKLDECQATMAGMRRPATNQTTEPLQASE